MADALSAPSGAGLSARAQHDDELALCTDAELIHNVRAGDNDSYGVLWTRYSVRARMFARYQCGVRDPEDIVSDAYLAILEALRNGKGPTTDFYPYLAVTIRNAAAKLRSTNITDAKDEIDTWAGSAPSTEDVVAKNAVAQRILTAFYAMNPRYRQVLWMAEVQGMKSGDITAELGLHGNHGAALLNRARVQFKKIWADLEAKEAQSEQKGEMEDSQKLNAATDGLVTAGAAGVVAAREPVSPEALAPDAPDGTAPAETPPPTQLPAGITALGMSLAIGVLGAEGLSWVAAGQAPAALIASPGPLPAAVASALKATGAASAAKPPAHVPPKVVAGGAVVVAVVVALIALFNTPQAPVVAPEPSSPAPTSIQPPLPTPTPEPFTPVPPKPTPAPTLLDTNPDNTPPARPAPARTTAPVIKPPKAIPVVISSVNAGPLGVCYPVLSGTAKPNTLVQIGTDWTTVGTVRANAAGRWTTGQLNGLDPGTRDVHASAAGASDTVEVRVLQPKTLSVSQIGSALVVNVQGVAGADAEVTVDGARLGTIPIAGSGLGRGSFDWTGASGSHTLVLRYVASGCTGVQLSMNFQVA